MKRILLIVIILTTVSCEDFALLERDQENVFFFTNINNDVGFNGTIKMATFNIKLGFCQNCDPFGTDFGGDSEQLDRIVEFINNENIDIVSLQEVAHEYDTSIIENQIEYIAERTNMNYSYGIGRALQTGSNLTLRGVIGNAILSKFEILETNNPAIRYIDYYSQNHCLISKIKLNSNSEINVLSTHFQSGSTVDEKNLQIGNIINEINNIDTPIILGGDFNIAYTQNNQFLSMLPNDFLNSLEEVNQIEMQEILNIGTFIRGSVIDYIYYTQDDFNIESISIAPEVYRDISDHNAYIVELTLNEN